MGSAKSSQESPQKYSPLSLGCYQEFLLDTLWRGRPFSHEGEFEVDDDPHLYATHRTKQRILVISLTRFAKNL